MALIKHLPNDIRRRSAMTQIFAASMSHVLSTSTYLLPNYGLNQWSRDPLRDLTFNCLACAITFVDTGCPARLRRLPETSAKRAHLPIPSFAGAQPLLAPSPALLLLLALRHFCRPPDSNVSLIVD